MPEELEWCTRKERIDKKLREIPSPWTIIPWRDGMDTSTLAAHAVEEYPTANGPADYAFFVKGKLLGILEAKKVAVGAESVLGQAKRYSRGAFSGPGNWGGYRVPFLYSSNGENVYFIDARDEKNISRKIPGFHGADALEEMLDRDSAAAFRWLNENPIHIARLRPYQEDAIRAVEQAIGARRRELLIAMATGTGKTFTTVAQVYRLLKSGQARRVLFLVDRKALAAQAVREFAAFNTPQGNKFDQEYEVYSQRFRREDFGDDEPYDPRILPEAYLTRPGVAHTFVYVSTIQRMAFNLFGREVLESSSEAAEEVEADDRKLDIPINAFDVIIADECHRGYTARETSVWRSTIEHFDAVKIGLTATPAAHTVALFREPVFRYDIEQAILDGYLVDYESVVIRSGVRMNGVFLHEGDEVGVVDTATGRINYDTLEDERDFPTADIERKITAPDSNRKIIREIASFARQHEDQTGRFPKILIFAANDLPHTSHADQLVRLCREEFGRGDDFVQKITGSPSVDRPLQKIREFRNRPNPAIAVTVDMLSTGVDIPKLEFIVFMRPVKSRILWVQMLGRGTRLCPEIGKSKFQIFDCFGGTLIEYFRNTTDFFIEPPQKDVVPIGEVIEKIYRNDDRGYQVKTLVRRLRRITREITGEGLARFSALIPEGDLGKFTDELPGKIETDFAATLKVLRDTAFQELLQNYPRAERTFWIAPHVIDTVDSEIFMAMEQGGITPRDYLEQFTRFVRENPEHIEAIRILLERPREWKTEALNELRKKLARQHFQESELEKAHRLVYNKALADIISMVKHAAREVEPIYTASERVDRALRRIMEGRSFDEEETRWLELIREHMVRNLTLEVEDFDHFPIFERSGGLGRARKVFRGRLESLVGEINFAVAS